MNKPAPRLVGAAIGAAMVLSGLVSPGSAEQFDNSDKAAVRHFPKSSVQRSQSPRDAKNKPWSLEDALPDKSPAIRAPAPEPKRTALGRVPLRSNGGTIGIETETQLKPDEFPDGKHTPGLDTSTRSPPQYLGLSLSVPTSDKSIIPAPLLPPWAKPE